MNQNTNNLLVIDFDHKILEINFLKYLIQYQEQNIMIYSHGSCQQFFNVGDLNRLFSNHNELNNRAITFRRTKKNENLSGKLIFNRVGKFGIDIHD